MLTRTLLAKSQKMASVKPISEASAIIEAECALAITDVQVRTHTIAIDIDPDRAESDDRKRPLRTRVSRSKGEQVFNASRLKTLTVKIRQRFFDRSGFVEMNQKQFSFLLTWLARRADALDRKVLVADVVIDITVVAVGNHFFQRLAVVHDNSEGVAAGYDVFGNLLDQLTVGEQTMQILVAAAHFQDSIGDCLHHGPHFARGLQEFAFPSCHCQILLCHATRDSSGLPPALPFKA
jgi:hypothetical protein